MKELNYPKVFMLLAGLSVATLAVYRVVSLQTDSFYGFLIWNLFLAWIPFLFSMVAYELDKRKIGGLLLLPLGVAWSLFFPNAPYLMTDLVHLTVRKSRYIVEGAIQNRYWYDLVTLLLFTWSGWLTGFSHCISSRRSFIVKATCCGHGYSCLRHVCSGDMVYCLAESTDSIAGTS